MRVGGQRCTAAEYEPNSPAENLLRGSEDQFVEEGRVVTALRPFQFVLVGKVEDRLPEGSRFLHLLVDAFGDAVENELRSEED